MSTLDRAVENLRKTVEGKRKGEKRISIRFDYADITRGYSEQEKKVIWKDMKRTCPKIVDELKVWKEVFGEIRLTRWRKKCANSSRK